MMKQCARNRWSIVAAALLISACSRTPTPTVSLEQSDNNELTAPQQSLYQQALRNGQEGDYRKASEQLERLVQQRPGRAELWLHLATAYYHANHLPQAEKALKNTLTLNPTLAAAHNLAGTLAIEQGDIDGAEKHFQSALTHNPQLADAHYNIALLYDTYYQDLQPAVTHYQAYLKLIDREDERTAQWVRQLQSALERQGG